MDYPRTRPPSCGFAMEYLGAPSVRDEILFFPLALLGQKIYPKAVMQSPPRIIGDLVFFRRVWVLWLVSLFLIAGKSRAQEEIFGSGDFILNEGPVYSDTGTWIGGTWIGSSSGCSVVSINSSIDWLNWWGFPRDFDSRPDNLPHSINASAPHGTVTKSPDQAVYDFDTQVILTATPEPGYFFQKWTVNGVETRRSRMIESSQPTLILNAVRDFEVIAHFVPVSRIIGLRAVDLAWEPQLVGGSSFGTFEIRNSGNSPLTVESIAYPAGFNGNWEGVIMPDSTQEITVTFAPTAAGTYSGDITVTSNATDGTAVIPVSAVAQNAYLLTGASTFGEAVTSATSRRYWQGAIVTLKAMPVEGYVFINWTEDKKILSTEANFDLPISREHSVWANYLPESRSLEIAVKQAARRGRLLAPCRGKISIRNTGTLPVYLEDLQFQGRGVGNVLVSGARSGWIAPGSTRMVNITFNPNLRKSCRLKVSAVARDLSSPVMPLVIRLSQSDPIR